MALHITGVDIVARRADLGPKRGGLHGSLPEPRRHFLVTADRNRIRRPITRNGACLSNKVKHRDGRVVELPDPIPRTNKPALASNHSLARGSNLAYSQLPSTLEYERPEHPHFSESPT